VAGNKIAPGCEIVVNVSKFHGGLHRSWPAKLVDSAGSLIVLDAVFQEAIDHPLLGHIAKGTLSTEYYWMDRWYNVFRFSEPDSSLRNFYCNVNLPPSFDGKTLNYIDLDIDVLVNPDLSYTVLDVDDFEQNATLYEYSQQLRDSANSALREIIALVEARDFPFAK
jgi:uncharacterized protein